MMNHGKRRTGPLAAIAAFAAVAFAAPDLAGAQDLPSYSNYGRVSAMAGGIDLALDDKVLREADWSSGFPGFGVSRINRLGVAYWDWNFDVTAVALSSDYLLVKNTGRIFTLGLDGKSNPTNGIYEKARRVGDNIEITDPQSDSRIVLAPWKTGTYRIVSSIARDGTTVNYAYYYQERCSSVTITHAPSGQNFTVNRSKVPDRSYCFVNSVQTSSGAVTYAWSKTANPTLNTVTYPDGTTKKYTYQAAPAGASEGSKHRVTSVVDGEGQEIARYGYDAKGRPNYSRSGSETEPLQPISVDYGTTSITPSSPNGATATRTVTDGDNIARVFKFKKIAGVPRLAGISAPCGWCAAPYKNIEYDQIKYDEEDPDIILSRITGLVSKVEDFAGTVTLYERDPSDPLRRVIKTTTTGADGKKKTVETQWHPTFNLPTLVTTTENGKSYSSKTTYDDKGRPKQTITSQNKTGLSVGNHVVYQEINISYTDHANGQTKLMRIDGPRTDIADVAELEYDAAGQLIRATNTLGQSAYYANFVNGRPQKMTLVDGRVATVEYDWAGRVKKASIDGMVQNVSYYKNGLVYQESDPLDATKQVTYTYDAAYRLRAVSGLTGSSSYRKLSYDNMGRKVVDRIASTNSDFYPDIEASRSLMANRSYSLGGRSSVTQVDGLPGNTQTFLDDVYRATQSRDALGRTAQVGYDGLGRVYAAAGRGASNFRNHGVDDNTATSVWYNNASFTHDAGTLVYKYVTDVLGGTRETLHPDQGYGAASLDNAGNVTGTASGTDGPRWGMAHDAGGRLKWAGVYDTNGQQKGYVQFNYDANPNGAAPAPIGLLAGVTGTWGTERNYRNAKMQVERYEEIRADGQTFNQYYTYLNSGHRASITYPSGRVVKYETDAFGRPAAMTTTAPGTTGNASVLKNIAYEPWGMLRSYAHANGKAVDYSRDHGGRIRSYHDGSQAVAVNYANDNRVASLSVGTTKLAQYTYNATTGRLTTAQGGFSGGTRAITYEHDNLDGLKKITDPVWGTSSFTQASNGSRLTQGPSGAYSYKKSGRVTSDGLHTLTYDDRGFLLSAAGTTYAYNNQGQRVKKTRADGTYVRYVYDDAGRLIGEHDGAGWTREYVWLSNVPVMMIVPARGSTPEQRYAIHTDFSATPVSLTDANGAVVWKWVRDPYGRDQPTGSVEFNFRLPGQYYDRETGYHYNGARYYDPRSGRYLQPDPMGEAAGAHAYAYTHSDPVNMTDPTGLFSLTLSAPDSISCLVCDAGQSVLSTNAGGGGGIIAGLGLPNVGNVLQTVENDFLLGANTILNQHLGLSTTLNHDDYVMMVGSYALLAGGLAPATTRIGGALAAGIVGYFNASMTSQAAGLADNWKVSAVSSATAAALAWFGPQIRGFALFRSKTAELLGLNNRSITFRDGGIYRWSEPFGDFGGEVAFRTAAAFITNLGAQMAWGTGSWEEQVSVATIVGLTSGWNTMGTAFREAIEAARSVKFNTIAERAALTVLMDMPLLFGNAATKAEKAQIDQRQ